MLCHRTSLVVLNTWLSIASRSLYAFVELLHAFLESCQSVAVLFLELLHRGPYHFFLEDVKGGFRRVI